MEHEGSALHGSPEHVVTTHLSISALDSVASVPPPLLLCVGTGTSVGKGKKMKTFYVEFEVSYCFSGKGDGGYLVEILDPKRLLSPPAASLDKRTRARCY